MSDSHGYVLRLTVTDGEQEGRAHLELFEAPVFKRRAALQVAREFIDEALVSLEEQVANARRNADGPNHGG